MPHPLDASETLQSHHCTTGYQEQHPLTNNRQTATSLTPFFFLPFTIDAASGTKPAQAHLKQRERHAAQMKASRTDLGVNRRTSHSQVKNNGKN
jgi:hypothetical protein